jgi:hypothetical protein
MQDEHPGSEKGRGQCLADNPAFCSTLPIGHVLVDWDG